MRPSMKTLAITATLLATPVTFSAAAGESLLIRAGTTGPGLELGVGLTKSLNMRVGAYGLSLGADRTVDGIQYDMKLKMQMAGAFVDWNPKGGNFRVTLGGYYNNNKVEGTALTDQNLRIGDTVYTPAEIGGLDGQMTVNKFSPYAGIGWGNAGRDAKGMYIALDLGVAYHGTPTATLTANIPDSSPVNLDPALRAQFEADLRQEISAFQEDAAKFKLHPVLSIGLGFRF